MDFAFNKSVTKEPRRRDTFFEVYFLQLKPAAQSITSWIFSRQHDNGWAGDVRWRVRRLQKKKERSILLSQSNVPLPPTSGKAVEKRAVRCAQQVPANYTQTLFNKLKNAPLFLPPPALTRDQKRECWHIKKKKKKWGLMTRSSGIFTVLVQCECPSLDVLPN